MSLASQEPINEVLANYDFKVLGVTNENYKEKKGVWWVKTPVGDKILKKVSCSEQTLKFLLSAVDHLTKNGILLPKVNKTKTGADYVMLNNICFTLTDAIKGSTPSYDSPKELSAIVKELAKFHKASAGFKVLDDTKPKEHLGTWIESYTSVLEAMNEFYKNEVQTGGNTPIGKLIVSEFPYFLERGRKVISELQGPEYKNWVDKIRDIGCLCHQDFAAGNLILTSAGLYVIDTDSITFELPARDIRKLFNKIMKKSGKANTELAKNIVAYYQSVNPLSADEWKVVKCDLMFPHLFFGAMSKYYNQREDSWTTEKYMRRIKEMAEVEKSMASMYDNFDLLTQNIGK
ncbi:MAG: spore coat protein CotS family [Clostridia bacterium]|nr:spore coat protein CotS family [Clostridia bacterium]